ncbi:hypothetical protein CMK11_19560, partial [Candidatus Poribacteria bacterium]|nr:hypothetical protein [Candidatus Poribacteria bacterium]
EWAVDNPYAAQPLRCILRVVPDAGVASCAVVNPRIEVGFGELTVAVELAAHQYLVIDGGATARVYDVNWNSVADVELGDAIPEVFSGDNPVLFACDEAAGARVDATFEMLGSSEPVGG